MSGTFSRRRPSVGSQVASIGIAGAVLAGMLAFTVPVTIAGPAERRVEVSREVDRVKIENLQRWVSAGHEEWCKEARLVALDELRRLAPAFASDAADVEALAMDVEEVSGERSVFVWTSSDGRATYRVVVERFVWLLPIAGKADAIIWVPTHAEIVSHR